MKMPTKAFQAILPRSIEWLLPVMVCIQNIAPHTNSHQKATQFI
jgi:hypothetical protein